MKPRYAAETRFSIRGAISYPSQTSTTSSPVQTLLSNGAQPLTSQIGFVDGYAANEFILSRDGMLQVAKHVDLPAMLKVKPAAGVQALYKAYGRAVASRFDMIEQINVVRVSAFSPADSRAIANALLAVTEDFVEREDEVGAENELTVSEKELTKAKAVAKQAEDAVGSWRLANHDIDPQAEATMQLTLIGQLEQELAAARVNYEKILAFGNPDHPLLRPAQMQVEDLERQIATARQNLTGDNSSQAARLKAYTLLKEDEAFEEANLATDQSFWLEALHDVGIMRRFVGVVARPIAQNTPSSPVYWILALEGVMAGLLLGFFASLGLKHVHLRQEKAFSFVKTEMAPAQASAA
jgi:capsular polysaccharide transport system permease protein